MNIKSLLSSACIVLLLWSISYGDQLFAPDVLMKKGIAEKTDAIGLADTHLGIAYRDDGALDSNGYFTTFSQPDKFFDTPGLNCSGLVVSISRFLFNRNFTLEQVMRDRLGDSGDNSPMGADWDFGWDLVMNLAEGHSPKVISADNKEIDLRKANGQNSRGFDLHDQNAWKSVLTQMRPGKVYLASISKPGLERGYKIMHYHVVLMLPDDKGNVWLYHSTRRSQAHKMNIANAQGMNRFMSQFKNSRAGDNKKIFILEASLGSGPSSATDMDANKGLEQDRRSSATMTESMDNRPVQPEETEVEEKPLPRPLAQDNAPKTVINHLAGKAYTAFPELKTSIPKLEDAVDPQVKFSFSNYGEVPRSLKIRVKGAGTDVNYEGQLGARSLQEVMFPKDFHGAAASLNMGEYLAEVRVDGKPWVGNVFEIGLPREAEPKITEMKVPSTVQSGSTFTIRIVAENKGAESDYGGITVSCPEPSGLKIISAKPGKLFPPGSTVLSVTTDRIRTRVPMAERWIELWGENKSYDMTVQIQAGRPGTYPLYVRSTLRGVNVKSSVVLMDPSQSQTVDQQGFPVHVHQVTVR